MKKIALALFGHPTFYNRNLSLLKYINIYNLDVYFHIWSNLKDDNIKKDVNFTIEKNDSIIKLKNILINEQLILDNLLTIYKPKHYLYESLFIFPSISYRIENNYLQSFFYSQYKLSQLIPDEYDIIIKTSFDINIIELPNLYYLDLEKINVNKNIKEGEFSISSYDYFKKSCNVYNNIQKFYNQGINFTIKDMFYYNLFMNNIKINKNKDIQLSLLNK